METDLPPTLPPKAKEQNILYNEDKEQKDNFYDDVQPCGNLGRVKQYPESHSITKEKFIPSISSDSKPIPAPRLSKKPPCDIGKVVPLSNLSCSAPQSAHFFNPLYFAVKSDDCNNELIAVRDTLHKRSSSDTDSIRFLENHKPLLVKSGVKEDWIPKYERKNSLRKQNLYNEGKVGSSLLEKKSVPISTHVYEMCEKKVDFHSYEVIDTLPYEGERECRDIFDSVSFKSPLYESSMQPPKVSEQIYLQSCRNSMSNLYDIPIPELPPPSYPPPPLPQDVQFTQPENGLPVFSLPPKIPPRPSSNPPVSSKGDVNQNTVQLSEETVYPSHSNKSSTVPTRPAPPIPKNAPQMSVPPPLPQRPHHTQNILYSSVSQGLSCSSVQNEHDEEQTQSSSIALNSQYSVQKTKSCTSELPFKDFCGFLYKTGSNRKEFLQRWCVLEKGNFVYYLDKKAAIPKNTIKKKDILGVAVVSSDSIGCASNNLHLCCFEISTSTKENGRQYLLGVKLPSERQKWIDCLTLAIAPQKYNDLTPSGNIQSGYLHVKEGTTGQWQMAWVVLHGRTLLILMLDLDILQFIDLRKSMGVVKLPSTSSQVCAAAYEPGPLFHIDMPQQVFYLQGEWPHHTETWFQNVHQAWLIPAGGCLEDQYLTQDNIPVMIDKCLNFISTHGTTEESIYRLAGSLTKVKKLLGAFSQNAWSVHLKPDEYSHHEAATVLKRFLRSLNECLLTEKLYCLWVGASEIEDQDERLRRFKELLQRLPDVKYQTLKRLIGHLLSIAEHSDKNLMPVINIAVVFGPAIIFKSTETEGFDCTNAAMDIVSDFITHYSWLFQVDPQEIEKERKIQQALELLRESRIAQRPAGDILVGVYIYSKDWGKCLNVRLTPSMTAEQLCQHAISRASMKESVGRLAVFEVVSNEELERPLHYTEIVLAVTLRWASWADADAKTNYLCIKHNYVLEAVMPFIQSHQPLSMFSELKFADVCSKTFKKILFEFIGAKLTCYKDARANQPIGQWNVEDITWYVGVESRRSPPNKWAFTFIDRNTPVRRTKSNPYFGRAVCCSLEEEYFKWIAAMLVGEYSQNLFPSCQVPDLLA